MRRTFLVLSCLTILAAPLVINTTVFAQTPSTQSQRDMDRAEHRELREEREKLRVEHEQLMDEHDKLKSECMDTKGQDRSSCEERKKNLRDRLDDWRKRRQDFNAKMENEHPRVSPGGGSWPQPSGSSVPSSP